MLRRLGFLIVLAFVLVAPSSTGLAAANPDPVGQAVLTSLSGSSVTGTAFIRRLANGDSHITVRVTGLAPGSRPSWHILSGGTVLITPATTLTASSAGVALAVTTVATTVPVSAVGSPPNNIVLSVYSIVNLGGVPPAPPITIVIPLASGSFYSIPDTGTRHSW